MPTYELALVLKCLPRAELSEVLKRTANYIFDEGGFIRKINNMGEMTTPYRMRVSKGSSIWKAHYFMIEFDTATRTIDTLLDSMNRDVDIVRNKVYKPNPEVDDTVCLLADEVKPPMYRKEVLEMIQIANRKKEWIKSKPRVFKQNTGLDFYPFQR